MKVEVCFSPALYPFYAKSNDITVVVVDVLRASTTICTALKNGASSVISVASISEAQAYKEKGYLVGAERNVNRCEFADFGNSPSDYTAEAVGGKDVVFTTTNGTKAVEIASKCHYLIVGCFANLKASAEFCINKGKDVMVLCAGWNNMVNVEDTLYGGALASLLHETGDFDIESCDGTRIATEMWQHAKSDIFKYVWGSEHAKRLESHNLVESMRYCLTCDTVSLVPVYDKVTESIKVN